MRPQLVIAAIGTLLLGGVIWSAQQDAATVPTSTVPAIQEEAVAEVEEAVVEEEVQTEDAIDIALRTKDVPALVGFTATGEELDRGRALVGLLDIATPEAKDALLTIQQDEEQSRLMRTWAVAARIELIETRGDLFESGWNLSALPEAREPFKKKAAALYASEDDPATLLRAIRFNPELATVLQSRVAESSPRKLVRMMLKGDDNDQRREAASYLGAAQSVQSYSAVAGAVVAGLAFDAAAPEEPWDGGALWIPSLSWQKTEAAAVVASLGEWRVACSSRNDSTCVGQVDNNLRSVGLLYAARGN